MTDSVMCGGHTDTSDIKYVMMVERILESNGRERIADMQKDGVEDETRLPGTRAGR